MCIDSEMFYTLYMCIGIHLRASAPGGPPMYNGELVLMSSKAKFVSATISSSTLMVMFLPTFAIIAACHSPSETVLLDASVITPDPPSLRWSLHVENSI